MLDIPTCDPGRMRFGIVQGVCVLGIFGLGYAVSSLTDFARHKDLGVQREVRTVSGFRYINPLLECDGASELFSGEYRPSVRLVQDVLDTHKASGDAVEASVYFRDLNNGPWFGIGEKTPFAASSMLKVAHMVAVYKAAEQNSTLLSRKVKYVKAYHTEPQTIAAEKKLVLGTEYTVEELIRRMIVYSDNEALYLLQDQVPEASADNVYADLSMEFNAQNEISIRGYSTLFRVLFNASYLTYESSEKALQLLSQTTFDGGLRAGVPISVPIAHKFGERALANPTNQLHDCGIIYYPNHPYLLCVMTRGNSMDAQSRVIADVSRSVYRQMRSHYGMEL